MAKLTKKAKALQGAFDRGGDVRGEDVDLGEERLLLVLDLAAALRELLLQLQFVRCGHGISRSPNSS